MVKVSVLGCGLMGIKIAGEFAYHGHRVKLYDSNVSALDSVYTRMEEDKRDLRIDGLLLHKNFIGQVLCMSRLEEAVNDADLILECVVEDLEMKKDLLERVSHLCKTDTIIASNTLRVSVTDMVERTAEKERTLGLRFLFPVYAIPEVEITPNKYTSGQTIDKVRTILEKMGKTLFFRSGNEPLILSEEQREERKRVRQQQIKNSSGMGTSFRSTIPSLTQHGGGHGHGGHGGYGGGHSGGHGHLDVFGVAHRGGIIGGESESDCAICMDREKDCVVRPCNHMVMCYLCATMLINRRDGCPICRKDILEIIKIYSA